METTKQKPEVGTQNIKRRQSKNITMENHQYTKEAAREEERNKRTTNHPGNSKALANPYLSILALNTKGLKSQIKTHGVAR